MKENNVGRYGNISINNNLVVKTIHPKSSIEKDFLDKLLDKTNIEKLLLDYLNDLISIGVKVAKVKEITQAAMTQEYIVGKTMIEILRHTDIFQEQWGFTLRKIEEIAQLILKTKDKDFRIDTNLANFIVCGEEIILVDIFPPIYIEKFNNIKTGDFNFLKPLFIDLEVQFIAFMGYVFSNITRNERYLTNEKENKIKLWQTYELLQEYLNSMTVEGKMESMIGQFTSKRLNCFLLYLENKYSYDELQTEIKKYSITRALDNNNKIGGD